MASSFRASGEPAPEATPGAQFRLQLGDKTAIAKVAPALSRFLEEEALEPRTCYATELVCEELLTNIAKYAGGAAPGPVELTVTVQPREVTLIFEDRGPPFDPSGYNKAPTGPTLEEAAVGGLGLHLVKKFASAIEYERLADINRTEVRISRRSPANRPH